VNMVIGTKSICLGVFASLGFGLAALGQQTSQSPSGPDTMWNADFMMEMYVRALTRQYNLSPDQEEYSRKLLTKRVKEFLKAHETDLRSLMWEMLEYQRRQQLPNPETARDWARRGEPIFRDARKAIIEGNKEWREILNEEQRARHDRDMQMLEQQFKQLEERLEKMKKGEFEGEWISQRSPNAQGSAVWMRAKPEDTWEFYLRQFAIRYGLDASQKETAQAVLKECRDRAAAFREKHRAEFEQVDKQIEELKRRVDNRPKGEIKAEELKAINEEMARLRDKKVELEKPIATDIFNEFKARLEQIPTKEQRAAVEQKRKSEEEARARLAARLGTEEKASSTTTAPAKHAKQ